MPKNRQLSDFLAKELLYDYVCGKLDDARKQAVDQAVADSEEVAADLKSLREGLKYCEALRNTKLSEPLFQFLSQPPKTWAERAQGLSKLKPSVRYGLEAVVVLVVFVTIGFLTPKEYRFWEADSAYTVVEQRRDEGTSVSLGGTREAANESVETEVPVQGQVAMGPPTTLTTTKTSPPSTVTSTTSLVARQASTSTTLLEVAAVKSAVRKGELFRVNMPNASVDKWTPEVVAKVQSLGGEKAGQVQLGWRRRGGSYFHFSMPEQNYETLMVYLRTLGPVRIVREPHPRVMPEGTIRLILWLEEDSKDKPAEDGDGTGS